MCRALIADPELPKKAAEGRFADIRKCIGCNRGCMEKRGAPYYHRISCDVNAAAGRERELQITPAAKPKRVLVIGGGPGGMEAARVAALRGHEVTLCEMSDKLGGQLALAIVPPHKEAIAEFLKYLVKQVKSLGITTKLSTEVTRNTVKDLQPDAVVLATGSVPLIPNIPGIHGKNVLTGGDALLGAEVGSKIIVVGGGLGACETAEYLAAKGKEVTILEMRERIAPEVEGDTRTLLLDRLEKLGTKMHVATRVDAVSDKGVFAVGRNWEADTVVICCGSAPNNKLASELHDLAQIYPIGECAKSVFISGAIHDGFGIALRL
jgi:NADPH-dependent 2,4-dienoyl-CoA reductase/sulfur reductase-like enzyme